MDEKYEKWLASAKKFFSNDKELSQKLGELKTENFDSSKAYLIVILDIIKERYDASFHVSWYRDADDNPFIGTGRVYFGLKKILFPERKEARR